MGSDLVKLGRATLSRAQFDRGLAEGFLTPLLPQHEVYLTSPGCDGARFARIFARTWARVPDDVQGEILRHWREAPHPDPGPGRRLSWSPTVFLGRDWPGRLVRRDGTRRREPATAEVRASGHLLRFHARTLNALPEGGVVCQIAHQLAHVYDWAMGFEYEPTPELVELAACGHVAYWGFDADEAIEWESFRFKSSGEQPRSPGEWADVMGPRLRCGGAGVHVDGRADRTAVARRGPEGGPADG